MDILKIRKIRKRIYIYTVYIYRHNHKHSFHVLQRVGPTLEQHDLLLYLSGPRPPVHSAKPGETGSPLHPANMQPPNRCISGLECFKRGNLKITPSCRFFGKIERNSPLSFPKQFTVRGSQFFLKMCPPFVLVLASALFWAGLSKKEN